MKSSFYSLKLIDLCCITGLVVIFDGAHGLLNSKCTLHFDSYLVTYKMAREVVKTVTSVWTNEGKGVKVRRSIGRPELQDVDPFLLLDEATMLAPAGFPDHPHRGFETVSYLFSGKTHHEDFNGKVGDLNEGDLQWMSAGRGIVHCEIPVGDKPMHGLQLWINLASKDKMCPPSYQELRDADIPKTKKDGVWVKVIAGESMGIKSPIYTKTPTMFLDFKLDPGAVMEQAVPLGWTAFVYLLTGRANFGPKEKPAEGVEHQTLVFSDGNSIQAHNTGQTECHFVLLAGQPLREPIARHGPFVMNTDEEIAQAMSDYRRGANGFENAHKWASKRN